CFIKLTDRIMKLKALYPLQIIVLAIVAFMLLPKTSSSCCSFKTDSANAEVKASSAETADVKEEFLFRY
ncbi:MAG TPA: hypothetical protein VF610_13305, partial [Segetibacter sp.]